MWVNADNKQLFGGGRDMALDAERLRVDELRSLLQACRGRMVRPVQDGRGRGLRQQDAADLAGLSHRYYADIERGQRAASAALIDQLASALQMTAAERSAAHVLAVGQDPPRPVSRALHVPAPEPGQALREIVRQLGPYPAALTDEMWTFRLHNEATTAWSAGWYDRADPPARNMLLYLFTGEAEASLPDVDDLRRYWLAALRYQYARNLSSPRAGDLVGRLLELPQAAAMWKLHEVVIPPHQYPVRIRHPERGIVDAHVVLTPLHPSLWLYVMHLPPGTDPPGT